MDAHNIMQVREDSRALRLQAKHLCQATPGADLGKNRPRAMMRDKVSVGIGGTPDSSVALRMPEGVRQGQMAPLPGPVGGCRCLG